MIKALLLLSLWLAAGCGSDSGGASESPSPSPGIVLEVDLNGSAIAYVKSDNVDPTTIPTDDATSHRIASLPSGLVEACHYTLSQGVNWQVWAIAGSQDSLDFARAYCHRNGQ